MDIYSRINLSYPYGVFYWVYEIHFKVHFCDPLTGNTPQIARIDLEY